MKNLKIALALVATFVVLQVANAQDYFNRLAMEGVEIVGAITYGKVDKYTTMTKGYYAFNFDQQFEPVKHHRSMQPMSLADASITTGKSIATSLTMQGKFSNKSPNGGSMMPKHLTCCRNMKSQTIATTQLPRWLMIQQPTKSMASTIPIRKVMW